MQERICGGPGASTSIAVARVAIADDCSSSGSIEVVVRGIASEAQQLTEGLGTRICGPAVPQRMQADWLRNIVQADSGEP